MLGKEFAVSRLWSFNRLRTIERLIPKEKRNKPLNITINNIYMQQIHHSIPRF